MQNLKDMNQSFLLTTKSCGSIPLAKNKIFLSTLSPIASRLWLVAELMWGSRKTLSDSKSFWLICGSCSNTSSPATPSFFLITPDATTDLFAKANQVGAA